MVDLSSLANLPGNPAAVLLRPEPVHMGSQANVGLPTLRAEGKGPYRGPSARPKFQSTMVRLRSAQI